MLIMVDKERAAERRAEGGGCAHPRERTSPPPTIQLRGNEIRQQKKRATRGAINSGGGSGGAKKTCPPHPSPGLGDQPQARRASCGAAPPPAGDVSARLGPRRPCQGGDKKSLFCNGAVEEKHQEKYNNNGSTNNINGNANYTINKTTTIHMFCIYIYVP